MCMVTALVLNKKYNFSRIIFHYMKDNITSGSKSWMYPRFVQMMLDHAYPNLVKDEQNDLLVLHHMDNETLIRLSKYTKSWPEPKTKTEFFGFIKDEKYEDLDPVNYLKWRNDVEMKEKSAIDELTKLEEFVETRNDWYTKEVKEKKRGGNRTPKVQEEEGSSSQPQKKRKKKAVETLLVDEPKEDETEADVEEDHERLSPETEQLLKDIDDMLESWKSASKKVVDDEEKSLSGSEDDVDAEVDQWIKENFDPREREVQKKRKRSTDDDDETYVPPENVEVGKSPSSGGRKKSTSRKRVTTPATRKLIFRLKTKPASEPQQPPSPPPQQPLSDPIQSSPQHPISSPIHEQSHITSPHIQQTPPIPQQPVDTTPGSSGFTNFPPIPENIALEQLDDFSFVNDDLVKKAAKEADQVDIDILKVRIAVLEEEKARRDEQNEYFKLKNKELEAKNAKKEHEDYMLKKVIEDLIGKSIEQRFEEIQLEELRAKRKAEIEAEMKNKGKSAQVEGAIEVTERAIVPSTVPETSILEPCPITSVHGDEDEDNDEEDEDDNLKDDADEVYSVHSDDDDDNNDDDDDQGTSGIKVTEASNEKNIDDYLQENENEEPENASREGEQGNAEKDDEIVDKSTRLILRLEHDVEEGEILHTYTRAEIVKMMVIDDSKFNFDFEEELNKFDINQQPEYQYKYVEDADNYEKVEIEDCSDEDQSENVMLILLAFRHLLSCLVKLTKMN
ncbi:glutamic acid-rich protein-like [Helianthus annuus]|uniref:glutamic acid-rich protein-like n=1 Tax=Helianthus annuus TaxID=4232 RepID=UPI000B8EFEB8|nr:glutamic acid-rich protein-like [Helianthus annuus]